MKVNHKIVNFKDHRFERLAAALANGKISYDEYKEKYNYILEYMLWL